MSDRWQPIATDPLAERAICERNERAKLNAIEKMIWPPLIAKRWNNAGVVFNA